MFSFASESAHIAGLMSSLKPTVRDPFVASCAKACSVDPRWAQLADLYKVLQDVGGYGVVGPVDVPPCQFLPDTSLRVPVIFHSNFLI